MLEPQAGTWLAWVMLPCAAACRPLAGCCLSCLPAIVPQIDTVSQRHGHPHPLIWQSVESMAADVRELLDALGLPSVVVMGVSGATKQGRLSNTGGAPGLEGMIGACPWADSAASRQQPLTAHCCCWYTSRGTPGGAPYACAMASLLPERVEALLLVCPLAPTAGREAQLLQGQGESSLRLHHGIKHHPWRLWASLHLLRIVQARTQLPAGVQKCRRLSAARRQLVACPALWVADRWTITHPDSPPLHSRASPCLPSALLYSACPTATCCCAPAALRRWTSEPCRRRPPRPPSWRRACGRGCARALRAPCATCRHAGGGVLHARRVAVARLQPPTLPLASAAGV